MRGGPRLEKGVRTAPHSKRLQPVHRSLRARAGVGRLRLGILRARGFVIVPAQAVVARWLESFKESPIRQRPTSFNLDEVVQKLMSRP
ncbi:hypothetical protein W02_02220 [Nitrospira sp. KM1]|nr:hypothetical protein W02_02220 [Nitrospira sp. KM1]